MRSIYVGMAIAITIPVTGVADTKKPLAKWTCADFLGVKDDFKPKLVYWASLFQSWETGGGDYQY